MTAMPISHHALQACQTASTCVALVLQSHNSLCVYAWNTAEWDSGIFRTIWKSKESLTLRAGHALLPPAGLFEPRRHARRKRCTNEIQHEVVLLRHVPTRWMGLPLKESPVPPAVPNYKGRISDDAIDQQDAETFEKVHRLRHRCLLPVNAHPITTNAVRVGVQIACLLNA